MELGYRPNIAAVIVNDEGLILCCERSDVAGAWQLPQGGIEVGERPIDAFFREIDEEIGTNDVRLLTQLAEPIKYEWPSELHQRGFRGQEQWYFLAVLNDTATIDLQKNNEVEFASFEWLTTNDFLKRISGFKAEAYQKGIAQLTCQFPGFIK